MEKHLVPLLGQQGYLNEDYVDRAVFYIEQDRKQTKKIMRLRKIKYNLFRVIRLTKQLLSLQIIHKKEYPMCILSFRRIMDKLDVLPNLSPSQILELYKIYSPFQQKIHGLKLSKKALKFIKSNLEEGQKNFDQQHNKQNCNKYKKIVNEIPRCDKKLASYLAKQSHLIINPPKIQQNSQDQLIRPYQQRRILSQPDIESSQQNFFQQKIPLQNPMQLDHIHLNKQKRFMKICQVCLIEHRLSTNHKCPTQKNYVFTVPRNGLIDFPSTNNKKRYGFCLQCKHFGFINCKCASNIFGMVIKKQPVMVNKLNFTIKVKQVFGTNRAIHSFSLNSDEIHGQLTLDKSCESAQIAGYFEFSVENGKVICKSHDIAQGSFIGFFGGQIVKKEYYDLLPQYLKQKSIKVKQSYVVPMQNCSILSHVKSDNDRGNIKIKICQREGTLALCAEVLVTIPKGYQLFLKNRM